MPERYEYQVCQVQRARVTFVNGSWLGEVAPSAEDFEAALASCPAVWDYLQEAGRGGWELVGAHDLQTTGETLEKLYLKRRH